MWLQCVPKQGRTNFRALKKNSPFLGRPVYHLSILWVAVAAIHFIHIGDQLDALADEEEDDDHE